MSQAAKDLIELRNECPTSPELCRLALDLIAPGVRSHLGGC